LVDGVVFERWKYAAVMVAPAAISATTIEGHQDCSGDFGVGWDDVDGEDVPLCPVGEDGLICCEIVTSRPALPIIGLPVPIVDWMMVVCERRTVMMTASRPSTATKTDGCLHHRFIGIAPIYSRDEIVCGSVQLMACTGGTL
jgi:hypothetical protein